MEGGQGPLTALAPSAEAAPPCPGAARLFCAGTAPSRDRRAVRAGIAAEHRYANRFVAVPRRLPVVPARRPDVDAPRPPPMTAVVVGPEGQAVWCDDLGRVEVRILGPDPAEHAHAGGDDAPA